MNWLFTIERVVVWLVAYEPYINNAVGGLTSVDRYTIMVNTR